MIVLAIAALIIVGVLLAVSGAQKSRRDAQRKGDLNRMLSNALTYESNHGGLSTGMTKARISSGMNDPASGSAYSTITGSNPGRIKLYLANRTNTACDGSTVLAGTQLRITMRLESNDTACVENL